MAKLKKFSGIMHTSVLTKDFGWYQKRGFEKEISFPEDVSIMEVAPDEVVVFCRKTTDLVLLTFVSSDNQKDFDYQKKMNDTYIIIPLAAFDHNAELIVGIGKKKKTLLRSQWNSLMLS